MPVKAIALPRITAERSAKFAIGTRELLTDFLELL
jgi:hypothetical protein